MKLLLKISLLVLTLFSFSKIEYKKQLHTTKINADTLKIKEHLIAITKTDKSRNYKNIKTLNNVASYIYNEFYQYADTTYYQKYDVKGQEYKNVIAVFGSKNKKTIVIGAHYDVCGEQEGADDNASGVTGLLELARMLKNKTLKYRIELVSYTLEEPPFFRTKQMGSYIHAKSMKEKNIDLYGMISLEMIGFYSDEKDSQKYPIGILSWFYGNKANYITIVNQFKKGKFAKRFTKTFKKQKYIRTKKITAPKSLQGIDFSDHLNYWNFGYSALMVTDTSFFRNENYHENTDTMDTLDINKIANVIDTVYETILNIK